MKNIVKKILAILSRLKPKKRDQGKGKKKKYKRGPTDDIYPLY